MGRKSKLDFLVKFIIGKNPLNIEDKELRVKKEEILSDEKIDIDKSTLYKLVNENDFLLVKGENIVLNSYDEFIKTRGKNTDCSEYRSNLRETCKTMKLKK